MLTDWPTRMRLVSHIFTKERREGIHAVYDMRCSTAFQLCLVDLYTVHLGDSLPTKRGHRPDRRYVHGSWLSMRSARWSFRSSASLKRERSVFTHPSPSVQHLPLLYHLRWYHISTGHRYHPGPKPATPFVDITHPGNTPRWQAQHTCFPLGYSSLFLMSSGSHRRACHLHRVSFIIHFRT